MDTHLPSTYAVIASTSSTYVVDIYHNHRLDEAGAVQRDVARFTFASGTLDPVDIQEHPERYVNFSGSVDAARRAVIDAVQEHLDREAQRHGYDGILSAASYAASTHPKFGPEGQLFARWRDDCWQHTFDVERDVLAAARPLPSPEEVIAELPPFPLQ